VGHAAVAGTNDRKTKKPVALEVLIQACFTSTALPFVLWMTKWIWSTATQNIDQIFTQKNFQLFSVCFLL
jgi:hypothetical protein